MADNTLNPQFPATPHKIAQARQTGELPRSRELGHFAVLLAGALLALSLLPAAGEHLMQFLQAGLQFDAQDLDGGEGGSRLAHAVQDALWVLLPLACVLGAAAVAAALAAGGWVLNWQRLAPRWDRVDPTAGLARMGSWRMLGSALKSVLVALLLAAVGLAYIHASPARLAQASGVPLGAALQMVGRWLAWGAAALLAALGVIALLDWPLQRRLWLRRLRMSASELRDEQREREGHRGVQAQPTQQAVRGFDQAPRSAARPVRPAPAAETLNAQDVLINGTPMWAVVLRLDAGGKAPPRVLAKGLGLHAQHLRATALSAQLRVLELPDLAKRLHGHTLAGHTIAPALQAAVNQALALLPAAATGKASGPEGLLVETLIEPMNAPMNAPMKTPTNAPLFERSSHPEGAA